MGQKLKVYGGHMYGGKFGHRGSRVIVAAHSWKEAAKLVDTPLGHLKGFWSMTGNPWELEIALAKPLTVFYVPDPEQYKVRADFKEWAPLPSARRSRS